MSRETTTDPIDRENEESISEKARKGDMSPIAALAVKVHCAYYSRSSMVNPSAVIDGLNDACQVEVWISQYVWDMLTPEQQEGFGGAPHLMWRALTTKATAQLKPNRHRFAGPDAMIAVPVETGVQS